MLSRLDDIEGKRIAQAQQNAAQEHSEAQQQEIKPKGEQGGYYSTMEAFLCRSENIQEGIPQLSRMKSKRNNHRKVW